MKYLSIRVSSLKLSTETTQEFEFRKQAIKQIKRILKNKGVMPSLVAGMLGLPNLYYGKYNLKRGTRAAF